LLCDVRVFHHRIFTRLSWRAKSSHLLFLLPKTKGGSTSRPNSFLLVEFPCRVRSLAAPATGARHSGRHDILLDFGSPTRKPA
jgi:hypothetical protein